LNAEINSIAGNYARRSCIHECRNPVQNMEPAAGRYEMIAHLSNEQIQAYRQRSLPGEELLELSEHIGTCEACRARLASPAERADRIRAFQRSLQAEPVHLSYEELEAYVDGTMAVVDRTAVEAHTRACRTCATDLDEILALRRELEPVRAALPEPEPRAGFWNRLMGWRGGLALAGAAACALLAILLIRVPTPQTPPVARVNPPATPQPAGGPVIRDGTRLLSIAAGGRIEGLDPQVETFRAALEQALISGRIEPSVSLNDLAGASGVLLGAPGQAAQGKLLEPLGTVVEDQRPVFRWEAIPGSSYRVSIYDDAFNLIAASGRLATTEWEPPKPLRRDTRYSWQLTVTRNGNEFTVPAPPAPEARFRVLGESDEGEIARARSQSGGSHLVLGILYARAGLLDAALQEIQALRAQNPDSVEVAGLLASLDQLRGRTQ
jgi:anti-sigma factor RsiW